MFNKLKNKMLKRNIEPYEISMEELKKKQLKGAVILDVRSTQEFNEGHLEGAINIPYYEINSNIVRILKDREQEIVLYCEVGVRSKKAYRRLIRLQYKNVYNLYGGLENWL